MYRNKKVSFTFLSSLIDLIEEGSLMENKSKSKFVSDCIAYTTDGNGEVWDKEFIIKKNYKNTIKKTYTIPINHLSYLEFFSKVLCMKKSHLVFFCIVNYYEKKLGIKVFEEYEF